MEKNQRLSTAKTQRNQSSILDLLRVLRAFAVRKHFGFLFEPAKDGSAVATACGRDDLGCTA
jgi:hypothetical protein